MSLKAMGIGGGLNAYTERVRFLFCFGLFFLCVDLLFLQDYTSYDVRTIGVAGMQPFLPIYGDHLLNPLLTEPNYATEVYHVTAAGEEGRKIFYYKIVKLVIAYLRRRRIQ